MVIVMVTVMVPVLVISTTLAMISAFLSLCRMNNGSNPESDELQTLWNQR